MLRLLSRRKASSKVAGPAERRQHMELPQAGAAPSTPATSACALSTCIAGSRATVLEVRCAHADACRLRALGLCEGAAVSVVNSRDCTLLEVRGARLAVSSAIAAGIMVMPIG